MNPRSSIRTSLLLAFGLCLGIVSLVQLATRYLIELPELYALEQRNDINAADQVRRAIANEIELKRALAIDNAHWLDAYEFIQLDPSGERFAEFAEREYTHYESMHVLPRVSGYTYFSDDGERFFESNYDLLNQRDGESLPLAIEDLPPLPDARYDATDGGFIQTPDGPILYVVTGITDDEATLEPVGHLVIWRKLDALFLEELFAPLGIDFEFMPVNGQEELIGSIKTAPEGVLPRDDKGFIHWLINDVDNAPLLIIRQLTPPRSFQDGLLSTSSIVGITASALLLLVLGAQLSRNLVQPLEKLRAFVEEVVVTEDFSQRLNSERRDEVGVIARRFDQLLERVERQEDELKSQNAELEQLAEIDSLTGLGNRRVFDRMLLQGWSVAARVQHPISCVMLDVDCFKSYNDHCGHQAGDQALQAVAGALASNAQRKTDSLCRFGGEEFVMLLMNTDVNSAARIAESMIRSVQALRIPHPYSDCAEVITVSAGVAGGVPAKDDSADALIAAADKALYEAKLCGRNRVFAHTSMQPLVSS